jgi:citrate lyase gamma subunit
MKYEQLESNVKKSFMISVRKSVEDLIREAEYEGVERTITDEKNLYEK